MTTASLGFGTIQGGPLAEAIAKQLGYTGYDQQQAFGGWTPDKWGGNLSPEMLKGVTQQGWTVDPSADIHGSSPSQFAYDPNAGIIEYRPAGQGPGEDVYQYDKSGNFLRTVKGSGIMSYLQGIAAVGGAALGMGALGGMTGAGAAAASDAGAGGGTFLGTGSATGGASYGLGGASTYGGSAIGSGIDFAAPAAAGGAGGAASYGLSPSIFTDPTLAEGAGVSGTGTGDASLFSNPAAWSGSAPGGAGYGFSPSMSFGVPSTSTMGAPPGGGGSGGGSSPSSASSPMSSFTNPDGSIDWMKLASMGAGALAGTQGVKQTANSTRSMDPRMDSLFYGQLGPTTQGLLAATTPQAQVAGAQLMSRGSGLLNTNLTPDVYNSPFYKGAADDLSMRTKQLLDQNNLDIQGNSVATGGLGGSRQGVAQGIAAGRAADYLQGNLGQLALGQYNQDATRNLQAVTLGAGLMDQGVQTPFSPAKNAASIYSPFTGFGTTNATTSQGGGTMGAVGGAIGAYGAGKQMGWW